MRAATVLAVCASVGLWASARPLAQEPAALQQGPAGLPQEQYLVPEFDQPGHAVGHQRDPALAGGGFLGYSDAHRGSA